MGRHYVWKGDIYGLDDSVPFKYLGLKTGTKLKETPKVVFPRTRAKPKLADVVTIKSYLLLLSAPARELLTELGVKNVEYWPVTITGKGADDNSYALLNVLGLVDALDRKHAKILTFEDESIMRVERYRLKKLPKTTPPIFRLGEFPSHTLVHDSIAKAFEGSKLTGSKFVRTEEYI